MGYGLKRGDGSVEKSVRRIAVEQIDAALAELDDGALDANTTAHQVRKRCKKLRGLVRLVRPVFDDAKAENAAFRDAAALLSPLRDSGAIIETYDKLAGHFEDRIERAAFAPIRRRLTLRHKDEAETQDAADALAAFGQAMRSARKRARKWTLAADGFGAIEPGLGKTYRRAVDTMDKAAAKPAPARLHEWRKHVKYHWYQARLLRPVWPEMLDPHIDAAWRLSELLGDHHDLVVLRDLLRSDREAFGGKTDIDAFIALIGDRQCTLEKDAFALGRLLLAEPPDALVDRWGAYWHGWRERTAA